VNGVFLVALCMTIFLEAIQRFVEPQEVSQPFLVMIVGCFGLASNIVGLFLFHDHGHSHGGGGHSHGHSHGSENQLGAAEEGHAHSHGMDTDEAVADESGNIADVLPESRIGSWPSTKPRTESPADYKRKDTAHRRPSATSDGVKFMSSPSTPNSKRHQRHHSKTGSRGYSGLGDIPIHPASFRNEIIAAGRLEDVESGSGTDTEVENDVAVVESDDIPSEQTPLIHKSGSKDSQKKPPKKSLTNGSVHKSHNHAQPKKKGGHNHDDLNMRGVFLHVMGDALGNIGVIASALFIWLTDYSWRFYSDPLISLIITVIILCSAIPLCKAASRILLQAVPAGLSVDDIKEDILALPDVISCHHLHVWQLSDTKLVASLHVQVAFEFKGEGSQRYMQLARQIRKCLHEYGIHSSTIQPEFCCEATHGHRMISRARHHGEDDGDSCEEELSDGGPGAHGCLLDCGDECGDGGKCCDPGNSEPNGNGSAS
jgi:zinc transporter 1